LVKANKQIDIPPEFYYLHGFQSFKHDNFQQGFKDIWPLMYKIHFYIERETGPIAINYYTLMKNLLQKRPKNKILIKGYMKLYRLISEKMFYPWKTFFKPTSKKIENYLNKIDMK